jgi:hypothetical protein
MNRFEELGVEYLQRVVSESTSLADVLRAFEYSIASNCYRVLKSTLRRHQIDFSHISLGTGSNLGRSFTNKRVPVSKYLVHGVRSISNQAIKRKLLDEGLLEDVCALCGLLPEWNGSLLCLQLDHVNGDNTDNRLENLRLLCPNCHTQTDTHSGKHKPNKCYGCGKKISRGAKTCIQCSNASKTRPRKFEIDATTLARLVWEKPTSEIARELGVSDQAVAKRCKALGIKKPPRGYWAKKI